MDAPTTAATPLWPLAVYFAGVLVLVGGMMGLSYILGERHRDPQTGQPFESGIRPTGTARVRFNIKYYQVAMFFVVFDLEAVFLFAWAVAARELSWPGYIEALVFVVVLVVTLAYLWKLGALDWGTTRRKIAQRRAHAGRPAASPAPGQVEPPAH